MTGGQVGLILAAFSVGSVASYAWRWCRIPSNQDIVVSVDDDGDLRIAQGRDLIIVPAAQAADWASKLTRFLPVGRRVGKGGLMDWQTVRYDPTYEEPLDPEIIPLCDALNAAGFVTISSCCGHGRDWPHVYFAHSTDERIERLARFVKAGEPHDCHPHFSVWQQEILLQSNANSHGQPYYWTIELHLTTCYHDTPAAQMLAEAVKAITITADAVNKFHEDEGRRVWAGRRG